MKKKTRRLIAFVVSLALLLAFLPVMPASAVTDVVHIYHTNDMHGAIEESDDCIGLPKVAAYHAADADSLLVDAGDFSQGTLFANMAHGLSIVQAMNAAGYDVAELGNHEFDFGCSELENNVAAADFTVLAANVTVNSDYASSEPNLAAMPEYVVKEVDGRKIAFFGLDTSELNGMVSPATLNAGGIEVRTDLTTLAAQIVSDINANETVDAIIAITHCGYDPDSTTGENSYHVAGVAGVDAVIDGHDHTVRLGDSAKLGSDGSTLVVSTGTQLTNVGCLTLDWSSGSLVISSSDVSDAVKSTTADSTVQSVIDSWNSQFEEIENEVVFTSEINVWGGNLQALDYDFNEITASVARRGETNAGSLLADARLWKAENWLAENYDSSAYSSFGLTADMPVVVLQGGGSVRNSFKAGDVTLGDVMTTYAFGFENAEDSYVLITPKVMYYMIEHGVNIFSGQNTDSGMLYADGSIHGRFPQAAGFTYTYDITQPKSGEYDKVNMTMPTTIGTRVQSIVLDDGTVLDRNDNETKIMLVTTSYEIGGGDSYWMVGVLNDAANYGGFQYIPLIATPAGNYGDAVIDYVNEELGGVITAEDYPLNSGRIKRVNDPYTATSFLSTISFTDDDGNALANTELNAFIDGAARKITTDSEGKFQVELANGPHELRFTGFSIDYDTGAFYLDNYAGLHNYAATNSPDVVDPSVTVSVSASYDTNLATVELSASSAETGETVTFTVSPDELHVIDTITATDINGDPVEVTVVDEANGIYSVTAGYYAININITFKEAPTPRTGDASGTYIWLPIAALAAAAAAAVVFRKKREKR
ncbi:MAG: bifunctional metallophosphatase/5'-nucleotidase [Oscillospiraceae bacterium]